MTMKKYLLLLFLSFCTGVFAQPNKKKAVDEIVASFSAGNKFSGVVLVADKGKIIYRKAVGYRDFAKKIKLRNTDIFELASVSKQFTAMVIMMLKEKGLLQYDDLVEKYLDLPYKGITIRHLLTHTSGLPDYQAVMDQYWDKTKVAGNPDILAYLNKYAPPKLFEPGARYDYSNTGYVLLASIAEKASGRDFIEFCTTEIFRKLGMTHTAIRTLEEKAAVKHFAIGHIYIPERNDYVRADSFPSSNYTIWLGNRKGPGRISSTADDLLKWDAALYTNVLVNQQTLEQAYTPMLLNDKTLSTYGFGWEIIAPAGQAGKIVWHNGDNPGYKTQIMRYIGKDRTLIILCNNASAGFTELVRALQSVMTN